MKKNEFFQKFGGGLVPVRKDDPEYGDYLLLHPEDVDEAIRYANNQEKYVVISVHESEDGNDYIDTANPCDFGTQPYKYGYYVINQPVFF